MLIDIMSFLHSLALYMVAATAAQTPSVTLEYSGIPRRLWLNKIVYPDPKDLNTPAPADPASVLRIYGGASNFNDEQQRRSIQCMTTTANQNEAGAMTQAQAIFETLLDPSTPGDILRPLKNLVISNYAYPSATIPEAQPFWKIVSVSIRQPPGKIGVDPISLRPLIVFNFDVGFVPVY